MTNAADKIIVALDVPTKKEALELVEQLRKKISFFKIGLQLFTAVGPKVVREILETGAKVFLDLHVAVHERWREDERFLGELEWPLS